MILISKISQFLHFHGKLSKEIYILIAHFKISGIFGRMESTPCESNNRWAIYDKNGMSPSLTGDV